MSEDPHDKEKDKTIYGDEPATSYSYSNTGQYQ